VVVAVLLDNFLTASEEAKTRYQTKVERDRQTERQTDRQTDRHRQTETETETDRQTDRQTQRNRDREAETDTEAQRHRKTQTQTQRHGDTRHRCTETETESVCVCERERETERLRDLESFAKQSVLVAGHRHLPYNDPPLPASTYMTHPPLPARRAVGAGGGAMLCGPKCAALRRSTTPLSALPSTSRASRSLCQLRGTSRGGPAPSL
jgi:hypothetical protein